MTTTDHFQKYPDYYLSEDECQKMTFSKYNTNPRYKQFTQTHFTAGAVDQFQRYKDSTNGNLCQPDIDIKNNLFIDKKFDENIEWNKYHSLISESTMNTFNYMFHKFKKGIFIKIQNNQLKVFLPFSKANFRNEWSEYIKYDQKRFKDMNEFLKYIQQLENRPFNPKKVNKFIDQWYANNCLLRYEFPIGEGDSGVPMMSDMFRELCKNRQLPDIEFFLNRRDFPIIVKNGSEAYEHILGDNFPLMSHNYDKYSPILSMVTTNDFADIPMPTWEDWTRVSSIEDHKFFPRSCRDYDVKFDTPFDQRIPTAVFRGASTGCGITIDDNPRLKIAYLSTISPVEDGYKLLDAGINKWNLRPRKLKTSPYLQTIEINQLPFGLVKSMSPKEQGRYKYIVNVDGHVSAFRLSLELNMGSVILLVDSPYKLWFRDWLIPYEHYIPIKSDLSDLFDQIRWCRKNDSKCKKITENAREFYYKYLQKKGILDYLQLLLIKIKQIIGTYIYNYVSPQQFQMENELMLLDLQRQYFPKTTFFKPNQLPNHPRSYNFFKGVEWALNYLFSKQKNYSFILPSDLISETRLTKVYKGKFLNKELFAIKTTTDDTKKQEYIHDSFSGLSSINSLLKKVPNFVYTFAYFNDSVITEYVRGETLEEYLSGQNFKMSEYLLILIQLSLSLQIAQQECGLVHNDIFPWNIILKREKDEQTIEYPISYNKVIRIKTNIIPIIIDYGKSHVIVDNKFYGIINPYKSSTCQDIISLLVSTLYEIVNKQQLSKYDTSKIIYLANFIGGSQYVSGQYFKTLKDIRLTFNLLTKYSEMVSGNKYQLENKTPLDLVNYINPELKTHTTLSINSNIGNSSQVFEYIMAPNTKEQARSFILVFKRVQECIIPENINLITLYNTLQTLYMNIESVKDLMLKFLYSHKLKPEPFTKEHNKVLSYLKTIKPIHPSTLDYKKADIPNHLEPANYDEYTFSNVYKLLELVQKKPTLPPDYTSEKNIIENVLLYSGDYSIPVDVYNFYIKNFDHLLNTNSLYLKTIIANWNTLSDTTLKIVSKNKEEVEKYNCKEIEKYLDTCQKILNSIQ